MSKQRQSNKGAKSGYDMATTSLSKDNEKYWSGRLFKHTRANKFGIVTTDAHYSVRISFDGRRKFFQLGTSNKRAAAQKARDIYRGLVANGWSEASQNPSEGKINAPTIGDIIRVYLELTEAAKKTAENYVRVFRSVVADIKRISGDKSRYDYVNGGNERWKAKVDNVLLSDITETKIRKWKKRFVDDRNDDPIKEASAKESASSYIRYCKSIFKPDIVKIMRAEINLPDQLPFDGVKPYKKGKHQYESTFDVVEIMEKAKTELPGIEQDQQWLIFTLAVSTGMRRNEIDKLTWRQINFDKNEINLSATKYFKPKSENSGTKVNIDPELSTLLRGYYAKYKDAGEFVIQSDIKPSFKSKVPKYRANRHLQAVVAWLRENGVEAHKPIHTLRKEAGSEVCRRYGLHAASTFLRHADIQVTSAHYVENKEKITSGLGTFLAGNIEDIEQGRKAK